MLKSALLSIILLIAQPALAQNQLSGDREEMKTRFLRFQQMRNSKGKGFVPGQFKNLSIRERIQKLREFRAGKQNSEPQAPVKHLDIAYGEHKRQKLDIYAPENASGLPVMLYIHGGAWKVGNKRLVNDKPKFFTSRNWIFVSANYRLLPDGRHPANVQDVASAFAWLNDNIEKFGGRADQIVLCGFSAGAHLSALAGLDSTYLNNAGKSMSAVKAVVLLDNPVSDVIEELKGQSHDRMIQAFGHDRETQINASPVNHAATKGTKPVFIIAFSGGMPQHSPMSDKDFRLQANLLVTALKKAGAR
jgi:acetyl esterase/lipase